MPEYETYVEAVGSRRIAARLDRIKEELSSVRGELGANEREHSELVTRHNLLCDEYERLDRKLPLLEGDADAG